MVDGCEKASLALLRWLLGWFRFLTEGFITSAVREFGITRQSFGALVLSGMAPPEPEEVGGGRFFGLQVARAGTVRTVPADNQQFNSLLPPIGLSFGHSDHVDSLSPWVQRD